MLRVPAATWVLVVWAAACSAGCHSPLARSVPEERLRLDADIQLITGLRVPEVRGPDGCGAQALATVLAHVDPGLDAAYEIRTLTSRLAFPRVMHWAVVSGMVPDGSRVLLAAPDARHHVVGRDDFLRRWSRSANCMIILSRDSDATPPASP